MAKIDYTNPCFATNPDRPSREDAERAVHTLLRWAGDDPSREGLRDTPARVARAFEDWFSGYDQDPEEYLKRTFEEVEGYDDMVVLKDIRFESHCEHHLAPIIGRAHVGYLPSNKVVGISKLARVVEAFARRLQVQEKMNAQIAHCIQKVLEPKGVAVVIEAAHQCMTTRGVHKTGVTMVTSSMLGAFRDNDVTRREFLSVIGNPASREDLIVIAMNTLELVKTLIGFDTTSRGSNLELIHFVQALLQKSGARCRLTHDATGKKANLFATIGPDGDGGYVLSGHTDVVPVDGQDWSSDPFKPEVRDGKLYGRGACDMKGFVGVALSLAPDIAKAKLKRPIHFALSYDEEVGCVGVTGLLEDLKRENVKPALALVGEPTLMKIVGAHKGGAKLITHCCGREHHSSAPEKGANAVMMAGEFVTLLDSVWQRLRDDPDPRFDPPHSTVQANVIGGGTAVNILAARADVTWEYRCLPDRDPKAILDTVRQRTEAEILPKYRARAAEAAFKTDLQAQYPGLIMDEHSPAVLLARELTGANQAEAVSYGTEAGHFQAYGIPAVICGPGSIDQAHRPDEFCEVSELTACEAFLRKVIAKAST